MAKIKRMSVAALALVVLAITSVVGITIMRRIALLNETCVANISGTVQEGSYCQLVPSEYIDPFITGLAIFGTFSTVLAIIVVGKIVLNVMREKDK